MNFLPITLVLFCFLCTAFSQFDFSHEVENHVEDHDLGFDLLFPAGSAFESGHRNLQASNTKYLKVSRYQFGGCQKKFQYQTLQYYPLETCLNPKQLFKVGTTASPNLPSNIGTWKTNGNMAILGNANPNSASQGATLTTTSTQNQIMGLKYTVNKDNVVEVFAYSDTACNNNVMMNNFPLNNEWKTMGTTMSTGAQYSPVNNVAVTDPNPAISTKPSGGSIQSFYATYNAAPGTCNDAGKYWPSGGDNKLSGQTQFYQPGSTAALDQAKNGISGFTTFTNQALMYYIPFSTKFEVLTNFKPTVLNPNAENIPAMQATSSSTTCTPPTGSSNPPMVVTLKSQTYGACTGPLEGGMDNTNTLFPLSGGYSGRGPSYSTVSSLFPTDYFSKKLDCVGGQEVTTYYKDYQCMYPLQRKVMNKCTWRMAGNYGTWNQKTGNSISGGEQNSKVAITNTLTGGWITQNKKVDAAAQPIPYDQQPNPFKQTVFNSGATGNPGIDPFTTVNPFSAAVVRTCTPGSKPETNLLAAPASQWAYAELYTGDNCNGQLFAKDSGVSFTKPSDQSSDTGILLGGACNQCVASTSDFLPAMSTKLKCTPANNKVAGGMVFERSFYQDMECKTEVKPVEPSVPTGISNAPGVIRGLYSQRSRNSTCIKAPSSQYLYPNTQANDYEYFQVKSYRWVIGGPPTGLGYTLSKYPPNGGTTCAGAPWQMATFSLTRADFMDTSTEFINPGQTKKFYCGGTQNSDCTQQGGLEPATRPTGSTVPGPYFKKFYGNIISASYKRTGSCDAGNINMQFAADPKSPKNDRFYSDILNTVPTGCQVISTQSTLYSCDAAPAAKKKSLLSPGEIAAVVILGFLGVMCCIAIGVWFFVYYKPKAGGAQRATAAGVAPPAPAASKNPIGNNL
jgi:hypothetical protein